MAILNIIEVVIAALFAVFCGYQTFYVLVHLFRRDVRPPRAPEKCYAVLICARNEEACIGQLIESIAQQDYPAEKVSVFVMADNCTDRTAEAAFRAGAEVYERQSRTQIGKGYALEALLKAVKRDYGDAFDGYLVFDADNLLDRGYLRAINDCMAQGYDLVIGYRSVKNYGDSWVSAGSGLFFLRESRYLNHSRAKLGLSCAISGTGFCFSQRLRKELGAWPYHLLTEDLECTMARITAGERIGYCPDAILYDEQPREFSQSWKQRLRWSKGYLQVFGRYGAALIRGVFRGSFSCYDMFAANIPAVVLSGASAVCAVVRTALLLRGGVSPADFLPLVGCVGMAYLTFFAMGALTTVSQWKRLPAPGGKKLLYTLTFPLYMFTYVPITLTSLFARVEWTPILHHAAELQRPAA